MGKSDRIEFKEFQLDYTTFRFCLHVYCTYAHVHVLSRVSVNWVQLEVMITA